MVHPFGGYRAESRRRSLSCDDCHARNRPADRDDRLLLSPRPLYDGLRKHMTLELAAGLVLAIAALIYLTYAMLRPEKF